MFNRRLAALAAALASSVLLWNCGGSAPSSPTPGGGGGGGGGSTPPPPPAGPVQIVAAGDIGECGFGAAKTGKMLDTLTGPLLALGDLAYYDGSRTNFRDCYDPNWGRHQSRTKPVPGNHEYDTDHSAAGYYDYFGELAGQRGQGYYAYTEGNWRIIALNSELPMAAGSPQQAWLRAELAANRFTCTLAYWHRPRWSSGPNLPQKDVDPLWRTLQEFGVDVVLNGHDHIYERFAPQDPDGKASATGIREFIVGTGGAHLYTPGAPQPNSEVRASVYGILIMTLNANSYQWDFVGVDNSFRDTNSGACH